MYSIILIFLSVFMFFVIERKPNSENSGFDKLALCLLVIINFIGGILVFLGSANFTDSTTDDMFEIIMMFIGYSFIFLIECVVIFIGNKNKKKTLIFIIIFITVICFMYFPMYYDSFYKLN